MIYKSLASSAAIILTFAAFLPYIHDTLRGRNRPHVFSWIIWGITTFVVFLAQVAAQGGIGAWPIGVSAGVTIFIATLAYVKRADLTMTRTDTLFFVTALSALPFWYFSSDPLWAVAILTTVDLLGFGPTFRKVLASPDSEAPLFYFLFVIRNMLVIVALESYSMTTVLFPAAIGIACLILIIVIYYRRQALLSNMTEINSDFRPAQSHKPLGNTQE